MNTQISYFEPFVGKDGEPVPGLKPKQSFSFESYLEGIRDGRWQDIVLNIRAGRKPKTAAPGVTPSGLFSYRNHKSLTAHSTIIALDFDAQDNPDGFPAEEVATDPFVYAMHRSISGKGWVVYVKIDPTKHGDHYLALEKYFADSYHAIADPSGKDVCRFRFVSYDPECFVNEGAKPWKRTLPKPKRQVKQQKAYVFVSSDVEHCINQLRNKSIDITDSYHDWLKIGMALANEYGENGRTYFHQISEISAKYDSTDCDKKYDNCLRSQNGKTTIASFFYFCKLRGLEIKTPRTEHIERVAKMQRAVTGKNGGPKSQEVATQAAIKMLDEFDGMYGEDVTKIVNQVMDLPEEDAKAEATDDLIADLKAFLRTYNIKHNEVTRQLELDGEPFTERTLNTIYVKALEVIGTQSTKGKAVSKDLVTSILESDFTHEYNPFILYFSKRTHLKPEGEIDKLIASLRCQPLKLPDGQVLSGDEYAQLFVRKWLLSCVASWHGTYSLLMLVLTGAQNEGKTKFFRNLLPEDLRTYYAESSLDEGKDAQILMCKKAIICDDEFAGKSKADYKQLKQLLSKQYFSIRRPYGKITEDLQRIAVLCGTSNEDEIINDPTGNRRIIPLPIKSVDWDAYEMVDKDMLWMELYEEWKRTGNNWMLSREEIKLLNMSTIENQQQANEEEAILMYFALPGTNGPQSDWMTNAEIRNYIAMHSSFKYLSPTKVGLALKKLGFEKVPKKLNGTVKSVYEVQKLKTFEDDDF